MGNGGRITDGGLSASEQQVKEAGEVKGNGCGVMGGKGGGFGKGLIVPRTRTTSLFFLRGAASFTLPVSEINRAEPGEPPGRRARWLRITAASLLLL